MKWIPRTTPSAAMVVSLIALFVALGGTSYAAITTLPVNSVGTPQLKNNAVTSVKVRDGSLLSTDFKAGQIPGDAYAAYKNGPVAAPASMSTIATLNVPQIGNYVIFAKLWMFDNVNTSVLTDCTLVAGSDTDESRTMLEGNSGVVVAGATVALNVVHDFTTAGSVALRCNGFGINVSINNIKITAIRVGTLTNTAG